jgi:hypothetical protein
VPGGKLTPQTLAVSAVEDARLNVTAASGLLSPFAGVAGLVVANPGTLATAKGSVTYAADGSFTYTPAADANGADAFTVSAQLANCPATAANVTVTVTIGAPARACWGAAPSCLMRRACHHASTRPTLRPRCEQTKSRPRASQPAHPCTPRSPARAQRLRTTPRASCPTSRAPSPRTR